MEMNLCNIALYRLHFTMSTSIGLLETITCKPLALSSSAERDQENDKVLFTPQTSRLLNMSFGVINIRK